MGAYLSEPVLDKHSEDENGEFLGCGASSMQGWRVSQEDAHNALIRYDAGKSFFAVYDGHGGHEVAAYCSLKLPDFIKLNQNYLTGDYKTALEESFVAFDAMMVERTVVEQLKKIAGTVEEEKEEGAEDESEEVNHLFEEASMPIEDVMAKYSSEEAPAGGKAVNPLLAGLKQEKKPVSPFLRGKNVPLTERAGGSGSSNKHIHFNEDGSVAGEGGVKVNGEKETDYDDAVKSETESDKADTAPCTPSNGELKEENVESSPEGSEKENKDSNVIGSPRQVNGEVIDAEGNLVQQVKGKGKGKGKGKSKGKSEDCEQVLKEKKPKKSATEIYEALLKETPDEDDEDSDDSEDEEFGDGVDDDDSEDEDDEALGEEEESGVDEDAESDEDDDDDEEDEEMVEADFTEEPGNDSGCTAVVALLAGTRLYVANAGDSRCVVCRDGVAVEMSFDHKPEDDLELRRIRGAGGKVTPDGRVNGGLNLSRAIGDHAYKQNKSLPLHEQMISPQPDIKTLDIDPVKDGWMILACDGIWNFMTSQEVVDYINLRIEDTPDDKLSSICEELFEHCLAPDTMGDGTGCDNMTAVIVKFKPGFGTVKDTCSDNAETVSVNGVKRAGEVSSEEIQPSSKKCRVEEEPSGTVASKE